MSNTQPISSSSSFIFFISAIAAIAGMLFGYDTGVISGAILFIEKDFSLSAIDVGFVVSAVLLGALIGSSMSGRACDYLGRRKALMIACFIFIIATIGSALAPNTAILIASRLVLGIAIGITSYSAPLYLAEIAPAEIRGMLVSLNQLAITIGIVVSYIVDLYFAANGEWRYMLAFGILPAVVLLLGLIVLPESPRWMLLQGLKDEAKKVLKKLRGNANVDKEFSDMTASVNQTEGTWKELFAKTLRPIIYISIGLAFFQQATGVNTIIYYAPTIFTMAGFEQASSAILATLGVGVVNVLFTIISLFLIDRWGRRPLLFVGLTGMLISLFLVGVVLDHPDLENGRWIAVTCIVGYIACFAMSLGPIYWLMISEIFPLNIRGIGTSLAVATLWFFNMMVALTFPPLLEALGKTHTFWLYTFFCLLGLLFVYYIVPETKGVSLEDIEKNLKAGKILKQDEDELVVVS